MTLNNEIEKLIRRWYLQDYINGRRARLQNDWPEVEAPREILTIFGGPHLTRETHGARDCYAQETRYRLLTNVNNLDKQLLKYIKGENNDITFSDSDAYLVHHPYCDVLVIIIMMANNNVHRILVVNGSSVDILYYQEFQKIGLKVSDLKPSPNPEYGFTGDSVTPYGSHFSSYDRRGLPPVILCDG